ncbi:AMP-binding protein [bacterium]|nr:AMP-binding protein [bacterium]
MNVAHLLSERVQADPEGRCLVYSQNGIDRVLTFREVETQCDEYAHGFRTFGLRPGDKVLLMERPGPVFVALTWALFKLGCVPVFLDPGMGVKPLLKCIEKLKPDALIGVRRAHILRSLHSKAFQSVRRAICTDSRWIGASPLWRVSAPGSGPFAPQVVKKEQLAAILYTSGSTGPAKGVEYRHGIFHAQVAALKEMFDFQPGEMDMPGFPLFALFSTALGLTCVLPELNPSRPANVEPARLVRAIQDWKVQNLQGSPAIWDKLGKYCRDYGIKLPSVRRVITFGAPISLDFIEMWTKLLDGGGDVYTPYGATEVLPVSLITGSEVLEETSSHTKDGGGTCIGQVIPGVQVRIMRCTEDPVSEWNEELMLRPGEVGEIVVHAEQVTWAYFDDPSATQSSKISQGDKIWHRMGDLGYLDAQSRLWIVGRKSHRVQGKEHVYYPVCAEGIADQHPDVLRSALVGLGLAPEQRPAIVLQLQKPKLARDVAERNRIAREVKEKLSGHPIYGDVKTVLFHKDFPVDPRHNAKIDREALAEWAATQKEAKEE